MQQPSGRERGAARVRVVEEEVVRRGVMGRQPWGVAHPLPSPPYIGGRLGFEGRPAPLLSLPPKLESI